MLDKPQNQNIEPQNLPKADEPEIAEQPAPAEISEPTITEVPKEEAQPTETPQEVKSAEEISAPVEAVEQSPAEQIAPPEPLTPTPPPQPPQAQPQPQTIEKIIYRQDPNIIQNLLNKARATIQQRKRAKLDRIMNLFLTKPQITNKDIQKLLHARKRTARRYLNQLEKEGQITQVGSVGRGVFYTKKQ